MADTWTTRTALPEARDAHAGTSIGSDKGYISGGTSASTHKEYSQSGDAWTAKASMPGSMSSGPGSTSIGSDKLYVYGALNNVSNYEYSQSGNSWATKTGPPWSTGGDRVFDGACTVGNDKAYGRRTGTNPHAEYSQSGDSWTGKTDMPAAREGCAGFTLGSDTYYLAAGRSGGTNYTTNYEYSQSGDSWSTKASKGEACAYLGGAAVSGKGYAAGGRHETLNTAIKTTEEYDQSGNSWTTKTDMPGERDAFPLVTIGSYKCYVFGGYDPYASYSTNLEYTAADPQVYDALEDMKSFLDAEWPTGLEYLKAALEAHGWSLEDLMSEVQAQAYTALEDLKTELSGNIWAYDDLKALLEGYAQGLEDFKTDIATSNRVFTNLKCELKTRDTQGPYVFNYPSPAPGQTGVPVNTNITLVLRDDGWGVDIDTVWVEVDGVRYEKGDPGFTYSGTPRQYTVTIDPTADFEYNRGVNVKAFAADLAGNPGLNLVTQ